MFSYLKGCIFIYLAQFPRKISTILLYSAFAWIIRRAMAYENTTFCHGLNCNSSNGSSFPVWCFVKKIYYKFNWCYSWCGNNIHTIDYDLLFSKPKFIALVNCFLDQHGPVSQRAYWSMAGMYIYVTNKVYTWFMFSISIFSHRQTLSLLHLQCDMCFKTCGRPAQLRQHFAHCTGRQYYHPCKKCDVVCDSRVSLKQHNRQHMVSD